MLVTAGVRDQADHDEHEHEHDSQRTPSRISSLLLGQDGSSEKSLSESQPPPTPSTTTHEHGEQASNGQTQRRYGP